MFVAGALGGVLGSVLAVLLPQLLGGSRGRSIKLSRFFGWVNLGAVRATGGAVFGIALSAAISLSTSNDPHQKLTYVAWYGLASVGLTVVIAATILIDKRASISRGAIPPAANSNALSGEKSGGRIYGGAAIGEAIRRQQSQAVFIAAEGEIALAHEEALEMIKLLRADWPHITPDGALVQTALPDWRAKTTDFVGIVLGSAQRAAFKGSAVGTNDLERLESEGHFLSKLALGLTPDAIRVDEAKFLSARAVRRDHEAAGFLSYENHRAPGAPTPVNLRSEIDALMREGIDRVEELSVSVQPERTKSGAWRISGGDAPDEWWDASDEYLQTARQLLTAHQPALLKDFEQGFNGHFREQKERSARDRKSPDVDRRPRAEKMLAFANEQRSTPREVVEATLNGLTEARRRLGN